MRYPYGYCGMPCALCTRYRTDGKSKCAGCSDGGYYTETCKAHRCLNDTMFRHCGECGEYPCARLGKMSDFSNLNTHDSKRRSCADIAERGFDAWYAEYNERAALLTEAIAKYNDGRMKRYLCELFMRLDIAKLRGLMLSAEDIAENDIKKTGKAFRALADDIT